MEYEDNSEQGSFFDRVKESPRTVSALIIILIVAAAIYAFSGDRNQPADVLVDEEATTEEQGSVAEGTSDEEGEEAAGGTREEGTEAEGEAADEVASTTPVSQEELASQNEALPQAEKTNEGYKEVAAAGEGVTHLARKATTRYLSENNAGYEVTNEHRIYIEDYIQKRLGSAGLEVGQTMDVSFSLLEEAVSAAGGLSGAQLNNLSQYTGSLR